LELDPNDHGRGNAPNVNVAPKITFLATSLALLGGLYDNGRTEPYGVLGTENSVAQERSSVVRLIIAAIRRECLEREPDEDTHS